MDRLASVLGYILILGLAWLLSTDRRRFPWRLVLVGTGLQLVLGWILLHTGASRPLNRHVRRLFEHYLSFAEQGAIAVFGERFTDLPLHVRALPAVLLTAVIVSILYYSQAMHWIVRGLTVAMQKVLGVSGAEALAALASIGTGPAESPLAVRPYLAGMTRSELHAVMVCGLATIPLGLLVVYSKMYINPVHLLTATLLSAPAGLMIAKALLPETQIPATLGRIDAPPAKPGSSAAEAGLIGLLDGMKVVLHAAAALVLVMALLAMADWTLHEIGEWYGRQWSLQKVVGYLFSPVAWLIGVPLYECPAAGRLLGMRMVATEYPAYEQLGQWIHMTNREPPLSDRSMMLLTFALCGFANLPLLGIQVGALSALAPERQGDIARLSARALFGAMLASLLTACIAGVLV